MYAVVTSGGKQYRVEAGSELVMERLAAQPGGSVTFDRVLLVGDGEAVTVGTPTVQGATVSGTVLGEALGPKLIIFKFKQKATYRRTRGHRQHLVRVRIDEINANGKRSAKAEKAEKAEKADKPDAAAPEAKPKAKASTKKADAPKAAAASKKDATTKSAAPATAAKPSRARKTADDGDAPKPAAKRRSPAKKAESKE